VDGKLVERRIVGGLLGQWAVWTQKAVELFRQCHALVQGNGAIPTDLLRLAVEITDANAAIFDAAHGFAGCIAGIHEVLRRQGLLAGTWCLDEHETLSPGQAEAIDRVDDLRFAKAQPTTLPPTWSRGERAGNPG
jgi:hypothetical protein